jgi:hypothetical protein
MSKRAKRALRATIFKLGYQNKSAILISFLLFAIALVFIWIGGKQIAEQLNWGLAVLAALGVVFVLLFLFHLIKPPAPKRRDANFIITFIAPPIVYGGREGLPPAEDKMRWVQAYSNIEVNYPTEIQTLQLFLKGKRWMSHEWNPIMSNRMTNPRFYYFQVPTSVDLTKHKAQLVVSTRDEDYGSDEFFIK